MKIIIIIISISNKIVTFSSKTEKMDIFRIIQNPITKYQLINYLTTADLFYFLSVGNIDLVKFFEQSMNDGYHVECNKNTITLYKDDIIFATVVYTKNECNFIYHHGFYNELIPSSTLNAFKLFIGENKGEIYESCTLEWDKTPFILSDNHLIIAKILENVTDERIICYYLDRGNDGHYKIVDELYVINIFINFIVNNKLDYIKKYNNCISCLRIDTIEFLIQKTMIHGHVEILEYLIEFFKCSKNVVYCCFNESNIADFLDGSYDKIRAFLVSL